MKDITQQEYDSMIEDRKESVKTFLKNEDRLDLSNRYLARLDFRGVLIDAPHKNYKDFTRVNFENSIFNRLNLQDKCFVEALFSGAMFINANFSGSDFSGADFRGANLTNAIFRNANFTGANLEGAILDCADFTDANLTDANFTDAKGIEVRFRGANLTGAKINKENFEYSLFSE